MANEMVAGGPDVGGARRARRTTLAALVVVPVVLGVLVYQSFLGLWFWTDDFIWLRTAAESDANVAVKEAFAYPRGASPYWRPLVDLYFFAMYELFSLNATVYHVATLAIHVAAGMLLGFLALRLTKSGMIAVLASGLFVISPTYSAMIPWATGVTGALSGLFSVILALVFLRWLDGGGRWWLIFAVLALAGALLSKEDATALPAVLVLMTLAVKKPRHLRDLRAAALLVLPLIVVWLAYALPQFTAVIGVEADGGAPQFSFGWHAVSNLGIAMSWVSLPYPLWYGEWVNASRWAALGVFTLIAVWSAARGSWLLPGLYLATVAMVLPSAFLNSPFAPRWTYHASLPWAMFIAAVFVGAYGRLSSLSSTLGWSVGGVAALGLLSVLSARAIEAQTWVGPLATEYQTIEQTIGRDCPGLTAGGNVYQLNMPLGGPVFAVRGLVQLLESGTDLHRVRPESFLKIPAPRENDCVLSWSWSGQYTGTSVEPGREGFNFWAPPAAENLLTGEEPMTPWRAELLDTGDGLVVSSSSEAYALYGVLIGEIEGQKNLTYVAYAWVKATSPAEPGTVTITLGQSAGEGPRNASASFSLTDEWQRIAVYRRTVDAGPGTLSLGITRRVGGAQQSAFLVKDARVALFAVQSPLN